MLLLTTSSFSNIFSLGFGDHTLPWFFIALLVSLLNSPHLATPKTSYVPQGLLVSSLCPIPPGLTFAEASDGLSTCWSFSTRPSTQIPPFFFFTLFYSYLLSPVLSTPPGTYWALRDCSLIVHTSRHTVGIRADQLFCVCICLSQPFLPSKVQCSVKTLN